MYSTVEAAQTIGVSKNTLLRWLTEGLIEDVERDWRGWRTWREQDVERAKVFQKAYHSQPIRRIKRTSTTRVDCAKAAAQSMGSFAKGFAQRPGQGI